MPMALAGAPMPTVYLETTVPSYLVAYPSRDLIVAAHQQVTHEWWQDAHVRFSLYISQPVLDEIEAGDPAAAARRIERVQGLPILGWNDDVVSLVHTYEQELGLSGRARADLQHIAFAVAYGMDYLLTWNCTHIANGEVIRRLLKVNQRVNRFTPVIVTPNELLALPGDDL